MQNIHFIAIGGAIMHQLAIALKKQGFVVTGSDDEINDPAKSNLKEHGLLPDQFGWFPEKIKSNLNAIVLGMHARADNPELLAAQKAGIPIYSFPQYVYEVSKNKKRIVIAGSHGKTTITSMVMHIMKACGYDFDYLVGAKVPGFEQSVRLSDAPYIILEGDEYPASVVEKRPKIFFYKPHISILSGVAWDHINVFPTYENYFSQFKQYLEGLDALTKLIYNSEDPEVCRVVAESGQNLITQPYATPAFKYADGQPIVAHGGKDYALSIFGRHNVQNVQAAIKVCKEIGITETQALEAIASFTGAARRLEKVFETPQLSVFRDFAHAPSKLKATLNAVREAYANHYLVACFELHTFSSLTAEFLSEYAHSMDSADTSIVYYSNHTLELKKLPPLAPETVVAHFQRNDLLAINNKEALYEKVHALSKNNGKPVFLLLMSSGTFDGIDWNTLK